MLACVAAGPRIVIVRLTLYTGGLECLRHTLVLCTIVEASISERSIVFEWQMFWVSSIMFDYRTQSKSIVRLEFDWVRVPNLRLTSPGKYICY